MLLFRVQGPFQKTRSTFPGSSACLVADWHTPFCRTGEWCLAKIGANDNW